MLSYKEMMDITNNKKSNIMKMETLQDGRKYLELIQDQKAEEINTEKMRVINNSTYSDNFRVQVFYV